MKKVKNAIISIFLVFSWSACFYPIDFGGVQGPLGEAFEGLLDKNEGLTSFRSLYIPSGGRAEAMGTAFTALANDISFFDYNAAASSTLQKTELAVFHNAWIADSAMETIAFAQRKKDFGYGAQLKCFYVPFTQYNVFGDRVSSGYYSETTAVLNASYNFLSGYDFKGIALGINLKGAFRSVPDYADYQTGEIISGSGKGQSSAAFMADLGMQIRFNFLKKYVSRDPNLHFGLSIMNLGAAFTGFGAKNGIKLDDPLPTHIAVGVSYRPFRPITFALEFQQPINIFNIGLSEKWAAALGITAQFTNFFSFHGGFLIRGANPRFSIGAEIMLGITQLNVNYTLDLTTSFNPINRVSLGAKFFLGDGGRGVLQKKIDDMYTRGLALYSEGKLDEAVDIWKEILKIDPRFDPALRGIEAVYTVKNLRQRINEIQIID